MRRDRVLSASVAAAVAALLAGIAVPGQAQAETGPSGPPWTASTPSPVATGEPGPEPWTVTDLSDTETTQRSTSPGEPGPQVSRRRSVSRVGVRTGCARLLTSRTGERVWVVRPGDTLGQVAACTGRAVPVLADVNGLPDPDLILIGARLVIPARTS